MQIHRVKSGESLRDIAANYEITEDRIRENNSTIITLPEGRELLILRPTRTYIAKSGDTPRGIASRFGIKTHELQAINPSILSEGIVRGREYAVKYPVRLLGTAAANGYFYKGTKKASLIQMMPYLTYITIGAYKLSPDGMPMRLFDPSECVRRAKDESKVTLMRVYDGTPGEFFKSKEKRHRLAEELIALATSGGFSGITLSSYKSQRKYEAELAEFLMELRRGMIGCDLILFTECDENTPLFVSELSDGSVFMYEKCSLENPPSFSDGEERALEQYSDKAESSKAMLYLNSHAAWGGNYVSASELDTLNVGGGKIEFDADTLLCCISKGEGKLVFESLENTKAKLVLLSRLGFSGIAFDIDGIRREELMLFSSLFSPVHYSMPYSMPI